MVFYLIMTEDSLSSLHTNVQILCCLSFIKAPSAPVGRCEQHTVRCGDKALFSCGLSLTSVISAMQTRQLVCMLVIACKYNNSFFHSWIALPCVCSCHRIQILLALSLLKRESDGWVISLIIHFFQVEKRKKYWRRSSLWKPNVKWSHSFWSSFR